MKRIYLLFILSSFILIMLTAWEIDIAPPTIKPLKKRNFNLDKTVKPIAPNLYAGITEVSNKQYSEFLYYLNKNNQKDKLKICSIDSVAWEILGEHVSTCFEYFYNYHASSKYEHYPAVNIKFEAAQLYCEWLTEQYNLSRKKKFNKVKFTLPSHEEWLIGAGETKALYTWGDSSLYETVKGGIRARLRVIDKANPYSKNYPAIAAPVKSFSPNKLGLYNLHGNVAEMLSEKGKAKGGSWFSIPEDATLNKIQTYKGPDPRIGFRYFMKVIEE